jgi:6-pyruvoyltetrahydropterin/6-carboxytetrahydropterin synthase
MLLDLALLRARIDEVRVLLDHHLLDEVAGLGPATLENLCSFIAENLQKKIDNISVVKVWREGSGDACRLLVDYRLPVKSLEPVRR